MLIVSSIAARRATGIPFQTSSFVLSGVAVAVGVSGSLLFELSPVGIGLKVLVCAAFLPLLVAARLLSVAELKDLAAMVLPGRWTGGKAATA
jgi:hypothetical protein